jgi:hypothetical protein
MGVFKSLVDKVQQQKEEIEAEATKLAAKKAAEIAVEQGKQAVFAAVEHAGRSLKSAGASLEDALFGPSSAETSGDGGEPRRAAAVEHVAGPGDAERHRKEPLRRDAAPPVDQARFDREIDDELAALKRKLARE